jgi:hypothetical protein
MTRIQGAGVYAPDTQRAIENQNLAALAEIKEVSADAAPFAAEWLNRLHSMTEPSGFGQLAAPQWHDPSAPPTDAELRHSLTSAFQKVSSREAGPVETRMSQTIERYLRLNLEMTHRIG